MNKNSAIDCIHFNQCSGCQLNWSIGEFAQVKDCQDFFYEHANMHVPLEIGNPRGWRTRAKLAVRGSSTLPHIGLFKEGTHDILDIPHCEVHHPLINELRKCILKWMIEENINPYNEKEASGNLRYIQITVEAESQLAQVCFVFRKMDESHRDALVRFFNTNHEKVHSIWINLNTGVNNVIFGAFWEKIIGKQWLVEKLLIQPICFHPGSFMQANLEMFKKTLMAIQSWIPENSTVVEYYAGVGSIGLSVLSNVKRWIGAEISAESLPSFEATCELLPDSYKNKVSFKIGRAEQLLALLTEGDCVIVDPPRKGLDEKMVQALSENSTTERIIYLSCGWNSFKRDATTLILGGWKIANAKAYLYFPGTEQIETLALFERN